MVTGISQDAETATVPGQDMRELKEEISHLKTAVTEIHSDAKRLQSSSVVECTRLQQIQVDELMEMLSLWQVPGLEQFFDPAERRGFEKIRGLLSKVDAKLKQLQGEKERRRWDDDKKAQEQMLLLVRLVLENSLNRVRKIESEQVLRN